MKKYFFYTANQGQGYTHPVMKDEYGNFMVFDKKERKPSPSFTQKLLHDNLIYEKEQIDMFEMKCVEVKVKSIDELCDWLDKYDKMVSKKRTAEETLRNIDNDLLKILKEETYKYPESRKKSYTETKAMGCTDIVYWNSEPQTNPKTGNEFFTPEDAKALFNKLKQEHADEIEDEDDEVWAASNYIWEEAGCLDDFIEEEQNY